MLILFIFTAILACISVKLLHHFFSKGTTVFQLFTIIILVALTLILLGYMTGSIYIPILDTYIVK